MRRTYDRERYLDRVALIREHVPGLRAHHRHHRRLPGRDRGRLRETLEVVEEVGFDGAFTFIYSPRRETEAADVRRRVRRRTRSQVERMERLVEVVQRRARERAQRFVGRTLDVLVEGSSRTRPDPPARPHRHNKVVNFDGLASAGEIVPVEITAATSQTLSGSDRCSHASPDVGTTASRAPTRRVKMG